MMKYATLVVAVSLFLLMQGCKKNTISGDAGVNSMPAKHVLLLDDQIDPATATYYKGAYVTFSNTSSKSHTLLSTDSTINSGVIAPTKSYSIQFLETGNYTYKCTEHNVTAVIHIVQ